MHELLPRTGERRSEGVLRQSQVRYVFGIIPFFIQSLGKGCRRHNRRPALAGLRIGFPPCMNHRKLLTSFVPGMEAAVIALLLHLVSQVQRLAYRWQFPVALSIVASPHRFAGRGRRSLGMPPTVAAGASAAFPRMGALCARRTTTPLACWVLPTTAARHYPPEQTCCAVRDEPLGVGAHCLPNAGGTFLSPPERAGAN